ncbi:SLC13 family permease [Halapricum salinum]|uniref:SLC13 family permease n=1 Tax=Halapricum salinum TaxID=1457250 RepID=A0A4D6H819_9EURY|nr:SLC13 family permease [Halapricum salinum]QCC49880.1 SLC13 family permease [Halapricum salinum]
MATVTTGMLLVFGLIGVALVLFVTEWLPPDITAIGVLVSLVVFEPYTSVPPADAIAGFASSATVTIIAMYILSAGIQETGIVDRLGVHLARLTKGSERKLLGATVGTTGVAAGIINNTPVVAVFIPMITGIADRTHVSPSKLLLPLSYAAMLGGTLTLIGTSTNILASDLAAELAAQSPQQYPSLHAFSMFEFTPVGVVVLLVGSAYLLTIGRRLTPARIEPTADLTAEFDLDDHLSRVSVREESPLIGHVIDEADEMIETELDIEFDLLQVERDAETYFADSDHRLEAGDVLVARSTLQDLNRVTEAFDLRQRPRDSVEAVDLAGADEPGTLVEAITLPESRLVGRTVAEAKLEERFDTTVLAIRRGETLLQSDLGDVAIQAGDTLLLRSTPEAIEYLDESGAVVVTQRARSDRPHPDTPPENVAPLSAKTPLALGIMAAVIGAAALDLLPIVIAALGGVFAMVATGCLRANEAYDAVSWNVIFLLAGVLPLGVAMQRTGGAELIADLLVQSAAVLPVFGVLVLFYVLTGLLANVITPVASVVLLVPIAAETASSIGATAFTFVMVVMFAASSAFMTPIGYQTNLMVYGPGGYRFTDYVRVGAPLQALLSVVATATIVLYFGV